MSTTASELSGLQSIGDHDMHGVVGTHSPSSQIFDTSYGNEPWTSVIAEKALGEHWSVVCQNMQEQFDNMMNSYFRDQQPTDSMIGWGQSELACAHLLVNSPPPNGFLATDRGELQASLSQDAYYTESIRTACQAEWKAVGPPSNSIYGMIKSSQLRFQVEIPLGQDRQNPKMINCKLAWRICLYTSEHADVEKPAAILDVCSRVIKATAKGINAAQKRVENLPEAQGVQLGDGDDDGISLKSAQSSDNSQTAHDVIPSGLANTDDGASPPRDLGDVSRTSIMHTNFEPSNRSLNMTQVKDAATLSGTTNSRDSKELVKDIPSRRRSRGCLSKFL